MKFCLKGLGLAVALTLANTGLAAPQLLDKVAVIVDDAIIMESEIDERTAGVLANIRKQGMAEPDTAELRQQIIERLIVESLQMQMAERAGVRIPDAQLNEAMANIAAQNKMDLDQFRAALQADGISFLGMRENVRQEMIIKRVQQGNVNGRIQISEQEVENFLQSEEGQKLTAPNYRVAHFMVSSDGSAAQSAKAKAAAELAAQRLRDGMAFEKMLAQGSINGMETGGSDLGWRKADELPGAFSDVVPTLEVGQVSEPLEAGGNWHVLKLVQQQGGEKRMIDQLQVRHILIKPSEILTDEQAEQKMNKLYEQIISGEADFAELAREHSEDIGSAMEGGDLGWTQAGQMVPAFDAMMWETEVDEVSKPFRSKFGWHIMRVEGKRSQDMSDEMATRIASNFIYQRKFEEELGAWLQKIRDEAYVDIK